VVKGGKERGAEKKRVGERCRKLALADSPEGKMRSESVGVKERRRD